MTSKPSEQWRDRVVEEAREVAAGRRAPECAVWARLFPESLLDATDGALAGFEGAVAALGPEPSDADVFGVVERVVLALNGINEDHGGSGFETSEREQLCDYIHLTLTGQGIDIPALAERNGMGAHEITDKWRDW
ncbi:hypothetical protein ACIQNU_33320 [Streptomyces sp. NPDC091292]|uniref:hypothetical protein n=1 Tax=Streptomyces sp. NPDC091292 TaxID=3365991 RepID=UPI00381D671C